MMRLTLLGTGTSTGVPVIGCNCPVCTSADWRDRRLRTSALLEAKGERLLFDCGPDFREQMLRFGLRPDETGRLLSAVFLTHEHADHIGGLDDLRPSHLFGEVPVYAEARVCALLRERFPYCFQTADKRYPGVPQMALRVMCPHEPVRVGTVEVLPLRVMHGRLPIIGFRIGPLAYITDMSSMAPEEEMLLKGVRLLVVNALRHVSHPTHQTISDAIALSERLGEPSTYLIHLTHQIRPHAKEDAALPAHVHLGYDGLQLTVH